MKHSLYLFLFMAIKQYYAKRKRSRIRAVQMDNLRRLLCIRRKYGVPKHKGVSRVMKGFDKKIDEGVL